MSQRFDIIVVGGGVVGLTSALAMQQRGFSVALIDANELTVNTSAIDRRVYAINHATEQLLLSLGVWQSLPTDRLSPYTHMHIWDEASKANLDFDARMIASPKLGTIIEESILKQALLTKIHAEGVSCFSKSAVSAVDTSHAEKIQLTFADKIAEAELLMIADGAQSPTRQALGVSVTQWPYHQTSIVATVKNEKPHQSTAFQVFQSDGPLAFLPLPDPHLCSIVWSTTTTKAQQLMGQPENMFNQSLTKAFKNTLGNSQIISARHAFPLTMRHTEQYAGKRWLLLGDAAHTIHPLAGLGLNVGLADLKTWLSLLDEAPSQLAAIRKLPLYQRMRKTAVWKTIAMLQGIKTIFSSPLPPLPTCRRMGLSLCNQLPLLKRWLIEQANN